MKYIWGYKNNNLEEPKKLPWPGYQSSKESSKIHSMFQIKWHCLKLKTVYSVTLASLLSHEESQNNSRKIPSKQVVLAVPFLITKVRFSNSFLLISYARNNNGEEKCHSR